MDVIEMENLFRRVVREELAALGFDGDARPVGQARSDCAFSINGKVGSGNPFDLSDAELSQAESLLPEGHGRVLRTRVMAFRLERKGQSRHAARMRKQADNLEASL